MSHVLWGMRWVVSVKPSSQAELTSGRAEAPDFIPPLQLHRITAIPFHLSLQFYSTSHCNSTLFDGIVVIALIFRWTDMTPFARSVPGQVRASPHGAHAVPRVLHLQL